jgi:glycosyltransferase involved in cell wall biosynthesis
MNRTLEIAPLVSVVVPVFNGDKYFDKCLESILDQTYQNWECIINNNCSKDNTLEVANSYASRDHRFKVFTNDQFVKMVDNWNLGCSRISFNTKYLKVVGADDWLFPESLQKMVELMEQYPNIGVCSSYRLNDRMVDMDGLDIWNGNVYDGKMMLQKQLTRQIDISGSNTTVMYAVDHLKKLPKFPLIYDDKAYHQDTELVYELMNISDVGFVFQVLTYTRRHEKAHTTTEGTRFKTLFQLKEKILWEYKEDNKVLNEMYKETRLKYAYFILGRKLAGDKKAVTWHKNYIVRKFKIQEYILGFLFYNKLSQLFHRIFLKLFKKI